MQKMQEIYLKTIAESSVDVAKHRWGESEGCLACAAVDYNHEVGCAYDAVFTVSCCVLATNETFFDVHSVVLSFFNCLIIVLLSFFSIYAAPTEMTE